jgi:MoxR-like ATPase
VIGQDDGRDDADALFAGGHILLEGPPGTAKTLLAHAASRARSGVDFGRIQFTPDLMPGDIIGANLFNFQTGQFTLTRGPIFTDLLLADEINRTPPKTQAALLEAMQERRVTIDGTTHTLSENASWWSRHRTRSSIRASIRCPKRSSTASCSSRGSIIPDAEEERAIIATSWRRSASHDIEAMGHRSATDARRSERRARGGRGVTAGRRSRRLYRGADPRNARKPDLEVGASPRAGAMLARAARAQGGARRARLRHPRRRQGAGPGRLLRHRVILSPAAQIDGRVGRADRRGDRRCVDYPTEAPR